MPNFTTDDGCRIHYELSGREDGAPILFSNSLSCWLSMWDVQAGAIGETHRVIRYDSRGHGRSDAPEGPYSMERLGRDAVALLDHLGVARTKFVGLSKGGMVGQWLGTHAPERVERLMLANTAAHMGPPDLWNGRIRTARTRGMAAIAEPTMIRWFSEPFRTRGADAIAPMKKITEDNSASGYAGCCAAIRDMDQRESIRAIRAPTLVVIGAVDPATTPAAGALIADRIPGARTVTFDAAHISNIEQPEAFTRALIDFMG